MAGQKPRQGWIYWINPYRVSLRCKLGHVHIYNLDEPGESENWLNRIGQLDKADKEAIEERLKYFLNIQDNPSEDWFAQNASPEIVKKVFDYLSEEDKSSVIEELINNLNS
ncbi:hypothetical protein [Anabaenopsis elenkinii]|uniref:Uncharacterized protein n=1 Tax=Anabaenopsis elenkinii CCIBt3563 TaxID=2779889 RepID=A0A7U3RYV6_9CYAN|nr:hypothetical protein [Anabaenopsis elenkinii]QOV21201.1 hypothetical protein IM676_10405 [Anabaenopsis elenkinii CCIBt3563]